MKRISLWQRNQSGQKKRQKRKAGIGLDIEANGDGFAVRPAKVTHFGHRGYRGPFRRRTTVVSSARNDRWIEGPNHGGPGLKYDGKLDRIPFRIVRTMGATCRHNHKDYVKEGEAAEEAGI